MRHDTEGVGLPDRARKKSFDAHRKAGRMSDVARQIRPNDRRCGPLPHEAILFLLRPASSARWLSTQEHQNDADDCALDQLVRRILPVAGVIA